ncbi:CHASE2 domain-containing protein [Alkalinema sp. FACHB-956]|uniref:CHASE2 domain-containing protein n=1 Tax=Alkalinema sp. FACHB-956 TaxID=2692768 RepID=UPI0016865F7E|nr:CHASE2 domain-containing protein [Alkalinema sp. FACHB-956]MBD2329552.1 CHASE2 domain-containing protein [Alkalinema sp. FACHB-956]
MHPRQSSASAQVQSRSVWVDRCRRVWARSGTLLTAVGVAGCIIALRSTGILQGWEFSVSDQFFRLRPTEPIDHRIVIVAIEEGDLQQAGGWPISNQTLTQLLQTLKAAQPRAIGLDLYRDLPNDRQYPELVNVMKSMPNLIGIEQLPDQSNAAGIKPPAPLDELGQVGFNNIILDPDQTVRRSILYWQTEHRPRYQESFALKLAQLYLAPYGIAPKPATPNSRNLKLGSAVFQQLKADDGNYVRADVGAYQVWVNFRGKTGSFRMIPLSHVLERRLSQDELRDRIVLIGSTATSLKDFSATPYNSDPYLVGKHQRTQLMSGVELQAHFVSQIISAVLDQRPLLRNGAEPLEWLWIGLWTWLGTAMCWRLRTPRRSLAAISLACMIVVGLGYAAFRYSWMIPVVPPILGLVGAAAAITSYVAHSEEELKRSTEFLRRVIDTIPDPVFVKDKQHHWIVLNEAYARFVGVPVADLVGRTVYDVFPKQEADVFWQQDAQVFRRETEQENEEQLTNIYGTTYCIATKRSLHKDAAGNLFLVGVIRDITQRKSVEEELRRTTAELSKSNEELRQSQNRLSYLANHDPLTGLPNRQYFQEKLQAAIEWAEVNRRQVALLFLDLDGFKQVNDTLGHGIGDQLLRSVSKRLTCCLRASDTVARLGGDEFTVILPAVPGIQEVIRVAEKILHTLAQPFILEGHTVRVTTSIGISLYPNHAEDLETLLKQADTAMYRAKQAGKSQFAIADQTDCE